MRSGLPPNPSSFSTSVGGQPPDMPANEESAALPAPQGNNAGTSSAAAARIFPGEKHVAQDLARKLYAAQPCGPEKRKAEKTPESSLYVELRGGTFGSKGADKDYSLDTSQTKEEQAAEYGRQVPGDDNVDRHVQEREPAYFKDSRDLTPSDLLASSSREHDLRNKTIVSGSDGAAHGAFGNALGNPSHPFGINTWTYAMYPANSENKDGPENAKAAERVATSGHPDLLGHTLLVGNNTIFDPRNVRKVRTGGKDAFETIVGPPVGTIAEDGKITVDNPPPSFPVHFNLKGKGIGKLPTIYHFEPKLTESVNSNWMGLELRLGLDTASEDEDNQAFGGYRKVILVKGPGDGIIPAAYVDRLSRLALEHDMIVIRCAGLHAGPTSPGMEDEKLGFINAGNLKPPQLELYVKFHMAWLRTQNKHPTIETMRDFINSVQIPEHERKSS